MIIRWQGLVLRQCRWVVVAAVAVEHMSAGSWPHVVWQTSRCHWITTRPGGLVSVGDWDLGVLRSSVQRGVNIERSVFTRNQVSSLRNIKRKQ